MRRRNIACVLATLCATALSLAGARAQKDSKALTDAVKQIAGVLGPPLSKARGVLMQITARARNEIPGVFERAVLKPALSWALERALPPGDEGLALIRRFFDRAVRGSALRQRLESYGEAVDAVSSSQQPAAQRRARTKLARRKILAHLQEVVSFDFWKALERFKNVARQRVADLLRSRIPEQLEQGLTLISAPLRAGREKAYGRVAALERVGPMLVGIADDQMTEGLNQLHDAGLRFVLSRVEGLAAQAVGSIFAAVREGRRVEPWMQPLVRRLQGLVAHARDHASRLQAQFKTIQEGLAALLTDSPTAAARARSKAQEEARLAALVVDQLGRDASKVPAAKALATSVGALRQAQAKLREVVATAAAKAVRGCKARTGCVLQGVRSAQQRALAAVRAAESRVLASSKQHLSKVPLAGAFRRVFAPARPSAKPETSKLNQAPLKLSPALQAKVAASEKKAQEAVPPPNAPPKRTAPKALANVISALGKRASLLTVRMPRKSTEAAVVLAKPGSGAEGAFAAMEAVLSFIRQDWKAALQAIDRARGEAARRTPKEAHALQASLQRFAAGVHGMYRAAARARVMAQRRLRAAGRGVAPVVNAFLGRKPAYLAGLYYRSPGPLGAVVEKGRLATLRLATAAQRLVLSLRVVVGQNRWSQARAIQIDYFRALGLAKEGLRTAFWALQRAVPKLAAARPARSAPTKRRRR